MMTTAEQARVIVDEIGRKLAEDPRMPDQATRDLCIMSTAVAQVYATLALAEELAEMRSELRR